MDQMSVCLSGLFLPFVQAKGLNEIRGKVEALS